MPSLLVWSVTVLLFGVGLAGTFIPALPGIGLIFAGILFYAATTGFASISVVTVVVLAATTLLTFFIQYIGAARGARAGGGRRLSLGATLLGATIGLGMGGPFGLLAGAFIGALTGSLLEGRGALHATRIATFSLVGILGATLAQVVIGLLMIAIFLFAVWF